MPRSSADGRYAVLVDREPAEQLGVSCVYDMIEKRSWDLSEHGNRVAASSSDSDLGLVVTGSADGVVRVGPLTGEAPHLLFGHRRSIESVAISPDGRWITSSDVFGEIRLWPIPEGPPLHTLSYQELLDRLRSLTNLRVVPDDEASSGYRLDYATFPGWAKVPVW